MIDVGGFRLNSVLVPASDKADLPPLVFIHGASGNLRDQMHAFRSKLEGRATLLFLDRPGHGYSERGGPENAWPDGQANAIAHLMEKRGIDRAIIVAHSFGGAIAASFALEHPEKTAGLLFLAPATHPGRAASTGTTNSPGRLLSAGCSRASSPCRSACRASTAARVSCLLRTAARTTISRRPHPP